MKKLLIHLIVTIIVAVLIYSAFAFVIYDADPQSWLIEARGGMTGLIAILEVYVNAFLSTQLNE